MRLRLRLQLAAVGRAGLLPRLSSEPSLAGLPSGLRAPLAISPDWMYLTSQVAEEKK